MKIMQSQLVHGDLMGVQLLSARRDIFQVNVVNVEAYRCSEWMQNRSRVV